MRDGAGGRRQESIGKKAEAGPEIGWKAGRSPTVGRVKVGLYDIRYRHKISCLWFALLFLHICGFCIPILEIKSLNCGFLCVSVVFPCKSMVFPASLWFLFIRSGSILHLQPKQLLTLMPERVPFIIVVAESLSPLVCHFFLTQPLAGVIAVPALLAAVLLVALVVRAGAGVVADAGGLELTQLVATRLLSPPFSNYCLLSKARARLIAVIKFGGFCNSTSVRKGSVKPAVNKSTCWFCCIVVARARRD